MQKVSSGESYALCKSCASKFNRKLYCPGCLVLWKDEKQHAAEMRRLQRKAAHKREQLQAMAHDLAMMIHDVPGAAMSSALIHLLPDVVRVAT